MLELFWSMLRVSTPLIFAALGGLLSERSGVIHIALEGVMLAGAFAGAAVAAWTGSPWWGLGAGILAGVFVSAIYALTVVELRANQIVAGTGINLLAMGATPFLCKIFFDSTLATPSLPIEARFHLAPLISLPIVLALIWLWLEFTPSGTWVRFAGEKPEALQAAGVSVRKTRWLAVLMSGVLAGAGGVSLSLFLASGFTRGMTAGRGFMALTALIFGKWRPVPAVLACLLFGLADALQIRLQGVVLWGAEPVPVQFIQILPYVVTVGVLAGWVGRSRSPNALGIWFGKT